VSRVAKARARSSASPDAVEFTSEITPSLLARVLTGGTLVTPGMLTIMLSGPLFLAIGALMHGALLLQWGYTLLVALPGVPLVSFGVAYMNAHRGKSREICRPMRVRADAAGLELEVDGDARIAGWSEFSRWRRMMGTHLLYTTARTFIIVRTDGLDDTQRTAFEGLLSEHIASGPRR
jgi:hypothetical protein